MRRTRTVYLILEASDYVLGWHDAANARRLRTDVTEMPEVPMTWVSVIDQVFDPYDRAQYRLNRDRQGRPAGIVCDPQPLGDAEKAAEIRRRVREEVDAADMAMALAGDAEAGTLVRDQVQQIRQELESA